MALPTPPGAGGSADLKYILDEYEKDLNFPVAIFLWNSSKAIILAESGDRSKASLYAGKALEAAEIKKSGFRFHQHVGLVGKEHKELIKKLLKIA